MNLFQIGYATGLLFDETNVFFEFLGFFGDESFVEGCVGVGGGGWYRVRGEGGLRGRGGYRAVWVGYLSLRRVCWLLWMLL